MALTFPDTLADATGYRFARLLCGRTHTLACAISPPFRVLNHAQQRVAMTRPDTDQRLWGGSAGGGVSLSLSVCGPGVGGVACTPVNAGHPAHTLRRPSLVAVAVMPMPVAGAWPYGDRREVEDLRCASRGWLSCAAGCGGRRAGGCGARERCALRWRYERDGHRARRAFSHAGWHRAESCHGGGPASCPGCRHRRPPGQCGVRGR